ncbi:MAG TPA: hypothetical protein VKN35_08025 [Xanthomonadales bacterium]|nr:hypothetical protein [Xanthomonadales bacterium]
MTERHSFIAGTLAELTRRKVLRTVGAYAVGVFVLLQLMDAAVDPLRLPDWLPTLVVITLILGFPLVFMLAWQFDITPSGIRRATTTRALSRSQNAALYTVSLLAMVGLGYVFYIYYSGVFESMDEPQPAEVRQFTAPDNSIAVLPFTDLSEDGGQTYFSDGVAEEILNLLAQVEGLHVAARTSSFAFRNPSEDIREIGRLLNVQTVLEGSIRSSGNRIRLTAQLINVQDGFHIWSQSYDREIDDLFAIQDEIASHIAKALVDSFSGLESKLQGKTNNIAAANAYRTGRLHWWRRTPAELETALGYFAEALEHDAAFAPAYAAMADTWLLLGQYGNISPLDATNKAQPMIEKALALDPESAEAFTALGLARWQIGQMDAAESAFLRALELNESYIPTQLWLAGVLGEQGRYPEEARVLEKAMLIDPLNELLVINYANNLRIRGEADAAREMLINLLDLRPDSTNLLRSLAQQELARGNLVEGWKMAHRAFMLEPDNPSDRVALAKTWVLLSQLDEAESLLLEGMDETENNFNMMSTYWLSLFVDGRLEEAETLLREMKANAGDDLPDSLEKVYSLHMGMIDLARRDFAGAATHLDASISDDESTMYDGNEILSLTLSSVAAHHLGESEVADARLALAERKIRRARVNGVDDAYLYYTEAAMMAMREDVPAALEKLEQAYQQGFRELWLISMDWRLDAVRDQQAFIKLKSRLEQDIEQAVTEIRTNYLASM